MGIINEITEGYYNLLKAKIKISRKDIEDMSDYRWAICGGCEDLNVNKCEICGCMLEAKTRAKSAKCPIGKW